ncbi:MAG: hypothetical protein JO307_24595 [Bryobacterales bacterium]|nr:hypothetical protein [Bryobacterales bacterium]MBV9396833.1 hypothetical protein [Bryobacterales bacterium]
MIETSIFTRPNSALLTEDEYIEFQSRLAANPQLGAVIKGVAGFESSGGPLAQEARAAARA